MKILNKILGYELSEAEETGVIVFLSLVDQYGTLIKSYPYDVSGYINYISRYVFELCLFDKQQYQANIEKSSFIIKNLYNKNIISFDKIDINILGKGIYIKLTDAGKKLIKK